MNKKNLSFLLLVLVGIGFGIGISELLRLRKTSLNLPQQNTLESADSKNPQIENPQDSQNTTQMSIQENQDGADAQDSKDLPKDSIYVETGDIKLEMFNEQHKILQFKDYPANIYQGALFGADESCVNCEGGPQEALKKGVIEYAGNFAVYKLQGNIGEIIVGVVDMRNGESLELPVSYKEVSAPFSLEVLSKANSTLLWVKGVESKNADFYSISAYVLEDGILKLLQSFKIPLNVDLQNQDLQILQDKDSLNSEQGGNLENTEVF